MNSIPYILIRAIVLLTEDVYRSHYGKDPRHAKEMGVIVDELERYQALYQEVQVALAPFKKEGLE